MINFRPPRDRARRAQKKFITQAFINFFGRHTQAAFSRKNATKSLVACFFPPLRSELMRARERYRCEALEVAQLWSWQAGSRRQWSRTLSPATCLTL
jgi:hypothetical protein